MRRMLINNIQMDLNTCRYCCIFDSIKGCLSCDDFPLYDTERSNARPKCGQLLLLVSEWPFSKQLGQALILFIKLRFEFIMDGMA